MNNRDKSDLPLISVITVVYNGEKFLKNAINSIKNQSYKNIEYIIIDGGSKDGTLEIIEQYRDVVDELIIENDNGIYDAMNKGVKLAKGEYIGFLNSDDWYEADALYSVFISSEFDSRYDFIYANLCICDSNGNYIYTYKSSLHNIKNKMTIGHPSVFIKSNVLKSTLFDLNFPIASDYDLVLNLLDKKVSLLYIDKVIVNFRLDGMSSNKNIGVEVFKVHNKHFGFFHSLIQFFRYQVFYVISWMLVFILGKNRYNRMKCKIMDIKFDDKLFKFKS